MFMRRETGLDENPNIFGFQISLSFPLYLRMCIGESMGTLCHNVDMRPAETG